MASLTDLVASRMTPEVMQKLDGLAGISRRIGSVASSIGIPQSAASSPMNMIMPTVVGLLGREVRERRLWEEKNPGTWEQLKDVIRFSWEQVRGVR